MNLNLHTDFVGMENSNRLAEKNTHSQKVSGRCDALTESGVGRGRRCWSQSSGAWRTGRPHELDIRGESCSPLLRKFVANPSKQTRLFRRLVFRARGEQHGGMSNPVLLS